MPFQKNASITTAKIFNFYLTLKIDASIFFRPIIVITFSTILPFAKSTMTTNTAYFM